MSDKVRILFVDDQKEVLDGLRRMARSMRSEWATDFALGGEQALEMMAKASWDVLVTDMRMPGMDGEALIKRVIEAHPHMIRIVLSGQYDVDSFVKSGWPAHQFLSKPCEADALKRAISHVMKMRDLLDNETIRNLVTRASVLPSLPRVFMAVEQELRSENASMQKVGKIISEDVGITAKVLQMVNSPAFGSRCRIESVAQGVVMLGADMIKSLVLYLQTSSTMQVPAEISLERISLHGVRIGTLAKAIARLEGQSEVICQEAFLAGLLQNIGSLIIICSFQDQYEQIEAESRAKGAVVWAIEKRILGASHAEVGAYLISLWGLSPDIAESVAYHNYPSLCPDDEVSFVLTALHVANALDKDVGLGAVFVENEFDFEYLEKQGLLDRLPAWQEKYLNLFRS